MTPVQAIETLKSRLEHYSKRPNPNADYMRQTADIINALIDLYQENQRMKYEQAKYPILLDFLGYPPELADIPRCVIEDHAGELYIDAFAAQLVQSAADIGPVEQKAYENRVKMMLERYRSLCRIIDTEFEQRRLIATMPAGIRGKLAHMHLFPEYIKTREEALKYLLTYGIDKD